MDLFRPSLLYPSLVSNFSEIFLTALNLYNMYDKLLSVPLSHQSLLKYYYWFFDYNQFPRYRKISNIRCTKSQNLTDSRLVLHLFLPDLLKPAVK